jgi:hypothetical protein
MTIVFLDTETTGLSETADVWEIGAIVREHPKTAYNGEWLWQVRPDLASAEPMGLRISRFYERFLLDAIPDDGFRVNAAIVQSPTQKGRPSPVEPRTVARLLCLILDGAAWVGAVPSFDEIRLGRFIREQGYCLTNHYHIQDVEALAIGYLRGRQSMSKEIDFDPRAFPWNSRELMRAIGVEQDPGEEHTALGDARWAMHAFDVIMEEP